MIPYVILKQGKGAEFEVIKGVSTTWSATYCEEALQWNENVAVGDTVVMLPHEGNELKVPHTCIAVENRSDYNRNERGEKYPLLVVGIEYYLKYLAPTNTADDELKDIRESFQREIVDPQK